MKKNILLISILMASFLFVCKSQTDSLFQLQVEASQKLYREIREINKTLKLNNKAVLENNNVDSSYQGLMRSFLELEKEIHSLKVAPQITEKKDSLLKKAYPQIIGGLIGSITAIIVFLLGWKVEKAREKQKENKKINDKTNYLKSLISSSIEISKKQSKAINLEIDLLIKDPYQLPLLESYPRKDLERLSNALGNSEYFHSFSQKFSSINNNLEIYREITNKIDWLILQFDQIEGMHHSKTLSDGNRKRNFSALIEEIKENSFQIALNHPSGMLSGKIKEILKAHASKFRGNETNIHFFKTSVIDPLNNLFQNIPGTEFIFFKIQNAIGIYQEIPKQNIVHKNDLEELNESLKEQINSLEKLFNPIK